MIITNIKNLRDPFVLADGGVYYAYGTGVNESWDTSVWDCYVNDSGRLEGEWRRTKTPVYVTPNGATKQFWAPEVHKYADGYYMLATYYAEATGHRGCTVLRAQSPLGPFVEISDGQITPHDLDCIDATLYVDDDGTPWLVFVHEWTCTPDKVGKMAAARLSDDLSRLISEPKELFRADAPVWAKKGVTDGCFLYKTEDGALLMLWSNFDEDGYCVAVAHAADGKVDGEWVQESAPIYKRGTLDGFDGGHGMIFTAFDGKKYMALHSPNKVENGISERTVLVPIAEKDSTLTCVK